MKTYAAIALVSFLAGALTCWLLLRPPEPIKPETRIISGKTYESMFDVPKRFKPVPQRFYITPTAPTSVDTVRVPSKRNRSDLRLFYGDLTLRGDQVRLGTFNPATRQWETQEYTVPPQRFTFRPELLAGWPVQVEAGIRVQHRSGWFLFGRAGLMGVEPVTPYLGAGVGYSY